MLIKMPTISVTERRREMEECVLKLQSLDSGVDLWAGGFGDDYTDRNQLAWRDRLQFWARIMRRTGARSAFEMGCNAGWNLSCIREYSERGYLGEGMLDRTLRWLGLSERRYAGHAVNAWGNDINERACHQSVAAGLNAVNLLDFKSIGPRAELTFTAGVLIHIEPEHLEEVMAALVAKSYRYVLAVEYAAEQEEQVEYRGHTDKCWRRPYGALYQQMGLTLIESDDAGVGFDRCQYWLMEK